MIQHIVVALALQLLLRAILRSWGAGTAAACAWAIAREITQAEYRWIEWFGSGLRANMPWWGGLDPRVWQKADPWLDWLVPCAVVLVVAFVVRTRGVHPPASKRP